MPAPALAAEGLVKSFGGKRVVDGVALACEAGSVLGLLGPNGAGKTTTLRMLYGFLEPEAGTIRYAGEDFRARRTALKRRIGVCTQEDTLDEEFSVRENLERYAGYFRPRVPDLPGRVGTLLDQFGLREFADRRPTTLSGGYRRRLMIARSVVHQPAVLFLDEPTTGLDPQARVEVWKLVSQLRGEGLAIVLTTHYMDEAERLSDRLVVLGKGRRVADGSPKDVVGRMLGEHVLVMKADEAERAQVGQWLAREGIAAPTGVLGEWQVALRAPQLAAFASAFPQLRYQVREPDLDDLFLRLAVPS